MKRLLRFLFGLALFLQASSTYALHKIEEITPARPYFVRVWFNPRTDSPGIWLVLGVDANKEPAFSFVRHQVWESKKLIYEVELRETAYPPEWLMAHIAGAESSRRPRLPAGWRYYVVFGRKDALSRSVIWLSPVPPTELTRQEYRIDVGAFLQAAEAKSAKR